MNEFRLYCSDTQPRWHFSFMQQFSLGCVSVAKKCDLSFKAISCLANLS